VEQATSRDFRPSPLQVGIGTALAVLIFAYPLFFDWLVARVGVRVGALALLVYGAVFAVARAQMGMPVKVLSPANLGVVAIVAVTAWSGDLRYLLLVPAFIYVMLAKLFWDSLASPISIIEHVARFIVPFAPEFIRSYCRKSTMAWSVFFLVNAAVIAWLALSGRTEAWRVYTGWQMFAVIGAICLVDFLIRKWWFRYYFHENLFDRVWARMFPAENTPMGRQSMEYIREKRKELGLPPP
jgi:uncharacterized membrane protein